MIWSLKKPKFIVSLFLQILVSYHLTIKENCAEHMRMMNKHECLDKFKYYNPTPYLLKFSPPSHSAKFRKIEKCSHRLLESPGRKKVGVLKGKNDFLREFFRLKKKRFFSNRLCSEKTISFRKMTICGIRGGLNFRRRPPCICVSTH